MKMVRGNSCRCATTAPITLKHPQTTFCYFRCFQIPTWCGVCIHRFRYFQFPRSERLGGTGRIDPTASAKSAISNFHGLGERQTSKCQDRQSCVDKRQKSTKTDRNRHRERGKDDRQMLQERGRDVGYNRSSNPHTSPPPISLYPIIDNNFINNTRLPILTFPEMTVFLLPLGNWK